MNAQKRKFVRTQQGMLLIEALVAIVIFTIGVLALIGVQANVMRSTSDSRLRMDAEFFVDQLVAEMNVDSRSDGIGIYPPATVALPKGKLDVSRLAARYNSASNGVAYRRWSDRIKLPVTGLPGSVGDPPTVTVTDVSIAPSAPGAIDGAAMAQVDIIVFWRTPNDGSSAPARRVVTRSIINE
jgi:type IV pilus assembly protein PilV